MFKMKYFCFTFIMFILFVISACTTKPNTSFVPPVECQEQESYILKVIPDPRPLSKSLISVNLVALEVIKGYDVEDAENVLNEIDAALLAKDYTYAEVVSYIVSKTDKANNLAGAAIFMLSEDLFLLNQEVPITDCDVALIRKHIEKQRAMLTIYKASKKK